MKGSFTQSMVWLHTWFGLVTGWLLFMIFVTGTLAVYVPEITAWMQPEARGGKFGSPQQSIDSAEAFLRKEALGAKRWGLSIPSERAPLIDVQWTDAANRKHEQALDPATGSPVLRRETEGGEFFNRMHFELRGGAPGRWIVVFLGIVLLAVIVSGVVIHKRIFKDFFTFRPGKGQRSWLDAHNLAGVMTLPFVAMIAYTGVAISVPLFAPAVVHTRFAGDAQAPRSGVLQNFARKPAGETKSMRPLREFHDQAKAIMGKVDYIVVDSPDDAKALVRPGRTLNSRFAAVGDHTAFDAASGQLVGAQTDWNGAAYAYRSLVGLHLAGFGGPTVRLLYFISGFIGSVLIATGLILFIEKRKRRADDASARFIAIASRINVAAVAGMLIACVGYLWANRLLPALLDGRAHYEIIVFFGLWFASGIHAFWRPAPFAWTEQLVTAASLCLLLPVLDAATSGRSPIASLSIVNIGALMIGTVLAACAWKVRNGHDAMAPSVEARPE